LMEFGSGPSIEFSSSEMCGYIDVVTLEYVDVVIGGLHLWNGTFRVLSFALSATEQRRVEYFVEILGSLRERLWKHLNLELQRYIF